MADQGDSDAQYVMVVVEFNKGLDTEYDMPLYLLQSATNGNIKTKNFMGLHCCRWQSNEGYQMALNWFQ